MQGDSKPETFEDILLQKAMILVEHTEILKRKLMLGPREVVEVLKQRLRILNFKWPIPRLI